MNYDFCIGLIRKEHLDKKQEFFLFVCLKNLVQIHLGFSSEQQVPEFSVVLECALRRRRASSRPCFRLSFDRRPSLVLHTTAACEEPLSPPLRAIS